LDASADPSRAASPSLPPPLHSPAAQGFAEWMAELDAMQQLRARDPAQALALILERRHRWPKLLPAQDALLRARCALQVAAAHLVLGDHEATRRECAVLDKLLVHRHLLTADASLRHHAQRCGIAAANVRAILAHGMGDFAGALRAYLGTGHWRPPIRSALARQPRQHLRRVGHGSPVA